jgi:hypothetical protein
MSKMIANVSVVGSDALDFGAFVKLQQEAFAEIISQTDTDYLFTESYYRWKYNPPVGSAKIALVQDEGGLIAANSMYPLDIMAGGNRIRGWQACDVATHPRGRGMGYFMKGISRLKVELGQDEIFFGFPNRNSLHGFIKLGWTHHSDVRTWMRILPSRKTVRFSAIEPIEQFSAEQDAFSCEFAALGGAILNRGSAYMNWRYKQHPLHQYEIFGWRETGRLTGVVVLRRVKIAGLELAIVMETLAMSPRVERGLLTFAARWARERHATCTLALNNTTHMTNGIMSGYVTIPTWALPKRQVLMGVAYGVRSQFVWNMPWRIQIGDWDGF